MGRDPDFERPRGRLARGDQVAAREPRLDARLRGKLDSEDVVRRTWRLRGSHKGCGLGRAGILGY
jgi:hypothetical protein